MLSGLRVSVQFSTPLTRSTSKAACVHWKPKIAAKSAALCCFGVPLTTAPPTPPPPEPVIETLVWKPTRLPLASVAQRRSLALPRMSTVASAWKVAPLTIAPLSSSAQCLTTRESARPSSGTAYAEVRSGVPSPFRSSCSAQVSPTFAAPVRRTTASVHCSLPAPRPTALGSGVPLKTKSALLSGRAGLPIVRPTPNGASRPTDRISCDTVATSRKRPSAGPSRKVNSNGKSFMRGSKPGRSP